MEKRRDVIAKMGKGVGVQDPAGTLAGDVCVCVCFM